MTNNTHPEKKRSLKGYLHLFFCGAVMGAADVVPGVSGGTMAFILGIYNELLDSIKNILSPAAVQMALKFRIREMFRNLPWPFLAVLGSGILFSIALFSHPIHWMLNNRLVLILAFFFGLVLGSVVTVLNKVERWRFDRWIALLAGAAGGFIIVGLPMLASPPDGKWYIVFCGAVAICAMILPGISGSFILLLMGKYEYILNAVNQLKSGQNVGESAVVLLLFAVGIVIGISAFVRFLSWLLKRFNDMTVAILIGFMLGSLRKVWPWKVGNDLKNANILPEMTSEFCLALLLAAAGFVLVLAIEYAAKKIANKQKAQN